MIAEILRSMSDAAIWPTIALILFMLVFIWVIVRVIRMDKSVIRRMKDLPLENDEPINQGDGYHG
ncbi:MAG: cbb3-type cytochrome c oxidase subunit 3 [Calditrichaeota bacterium]|nr:MAG: cbb3-type cytochrome c oxidase subunit 3 [Calditrichota bacterium]